MICSRSTVLSPTASGSSSDACHASTPSGRGTRLTRGTATFSVRQPSDHSPMSFFFLQSSELARGALGAVVARQRRLDRHRRRRPAPSSTPSPTLSTRPAKSWPGTRGNGVSIRPSYWWLSVPHSDADSTRDDHPARPGLGLGTVLDPDLLDPGQDGGAHLRSPRAANSRSVMIVERLVDVAGQVAGDDRGPLGDGHRAQVRDLDGRGRGSPGRPPAGRSRASGGWRRAGAARSRSSAAGSPARRGRSPRGRRTAGRGRCGGVRRSPSHISVHTLMCEITWATVQPPPRCARCRSPSSRRRRAS